jgi:nitrite reductase/ring-hydroxylating ferredoxin subunit
MSWQDAAAVEDLPRDRPFLPLRVARVDLLIARVDEAFFAVEDRCAHAGCRFSEDGELAGSELICNCHGSEYDVRTGEVLRGPADRSIRAIPVRVAGDRLEVDL